MKTRKIYFICPNTRRPSGGVKQMFQMVDHLNELGYDAYIVRSNSYKPITWFNYQTKIKYFPYLFFLIKYLCVKGRSKSDFKFRFLNLFRLDRNLPEKDSIIVYPEIYGEKINVILPNKYVIFNQNCFLTFNLFDYKKDRNVYASENMLGGITVSENSLEYLNFAFKSTKFYRIRLGLPELFNLGKQKKKRIAFMPRKLSYDSNQVLNILKERDVLNDWEIVAIDNSTQYNVACELQEAAIFLSFNHQEGFGLPPVEAMACGCYVIGYAGFGGLEYFKPEFSSLIKDGDIISFAKEIERIVSIYDLNPVEIINKGFMASNFVKNEYSILNEKSDTSYIWGDVFKKLSN